MGKTFVIGDIHGRLAALLEVLIASKFDYLDDDLIVLGDVVDGGPNTKGVVEELLKINHLHFIIGNHDKWFIQHMSRGFDEPMWINQGGAATLISYGADIMLGQHIMDEPLIYDVDNMTIPVTHQDFFNRGMYYYIYGKKIFVHGGFDVTKNIYNQDNHTLTWDRTIIKVAKEKKIPQYDEVFIGHTTTERHGSYPIKYNNLYMMDCGAGCAGRLCIMNVETKQFWLSAYQKPYIL